MFDHCRKATFALVLTILFGTVSLPAASLRWINLGTIDSGLVNLAIDGKVAYRKMPPGRATPWGSIPPGLHRFQIASDEKPGSVFELEINESQKITIVTYSDKNGDLQSRTFGLEKPKSDLFVFNLLPGAMMSLPDTNQKVISGKGFWLPGDKTEATVSLVDGEGFDGKVDFSLLSKSQKSPYFAIISGNAEGKPILTVLRDSDSLFEISDESIEIAGELAARIRIISEGSGATAGDFDPSGINWEEVKSQIFWLNLAIDRDPCRLEIRGFPALRRMPSGRGSGFLKWPAGSWKADVVVEATNKQVASDSFSLANSASIGLISTGGGKYPHRLLSFSGRSSEEGGAAAKPQIRFVNALPDGLLRVSVQYDPEPVLVTLEPGEAGEILPLGKDGFPGATLNFARGNAKNQEIGKIPKMPSIPPGDWVVVVHLDQESFAAPVLTWVEMDKGTIAFPGTQGVEE